MKAADLYGFNTLPIDEHSVRLPDDPPGTNGVIVYPQKDRVTWVHGEGMGSVAIGPGARPQTFMCQRFGYLRALLRKWRGLPAFRWVHEIL